MHSLYLFDLDGTLVDTAPEIADATNALLASARLPRVDESLVRQWIGHGTRELLVHAEDIRRTGLAALDLASVACGRSDAYFEAGVKDWDIAAGVLLVREAGGKVCDFRGAALGKIDGRTALPRQIVAGNLKVAEALQKTIVSSGYAASFNG